MSALGGRNQELHVGELIPIEVLAGTMGDESVRVCKSSKNSNPTSQGQQVST
jgi:hypothetical protein